jgi:predicted NAD/FAD-binding protein
MRVVIIGAGAAGVFTAYRLHEALGEACEIILLEAQPHIGGNARSVALDVGGTSYSIDLGAQFFFRNPQPQYVELLERLGLFDPPRQIDARATGLTLWDGAANERLLWLPSDVSGFLRYRPQDWDRLIEFTKFLVYGLLLDRLRPHDWNLSVDDWIKGLTLVDAAFKDRVLRPFLYQFLTLPLDRIGEGSALYAITYFVRNVFGEARTDAPDPDAGRLAGFPTFSTYQSRIGLDGVLQRALDAAGVTPRVNELAAAIRKTPSGQLEITTSSDTLLADHVVIATDPQIAAAMLNAGAFPAPDLIDSLQQCEYSDLAISIQQGGSCWMPGDQRYAEAVNTIVDGDRLTFSVWFGPLRDADASGQRIPVFKSWATPELDPAACSHHVLSHAHRILMPTTSFMAHRRSIETHQGNEGLWIAGGWTTWFDSQEAALDSATGVVQGIAGAARAAVNQTARFDHDHQRDLVGRWIAGIAAVAPGDRRRKLATVIDDIDARG